MRPELITFVDKLVVKNFKYLCIVINHGAGISCVEIGGVTNGLRRGVAVNINDALHVVRGEGRLVETDQSAGGGGGSLTDGLMGSEIEASGRLDQTDFLHDGPLLLLSSPSFLCCWWWKGRKTGVKGRSGTNHQPS